MKTLSRAGILFFLVTLGCVEEFKLEIDEQYGQFVVAGHITDQEGPHRITVARTTYTPSAKDVPVREAVVQLFEDGLLIETLSEDKKKPGVYLTRIDRKGEIGKAYHVVVTTKDKKTYQSRPDKMPEALPAGNLIARFDLEENGVNIFVDGQNGLKHTDCVRWDWFGTYQISVLSNGQVVDQCWVDEVNESLSLSAGAQLKFPGLIGFIRNEKGRLKEKYYVGLRQLSLSKTAFQYWTEVNVQKEASGDFFLPALGEIVGNVVSVDAPDEQVLGFFYAASVTENSTFITKSIFPIGSALPGNGNCNVENATKIRPSYWR